jgi:hypothetical protein
VRKRKKKKFEAKKCPPHQEFHFLNGLDSDVGIQLSEPAFVVKPKQRFSAALQQILRFFVTLNVVEGILESTSALERHGQMMQRRGEGGWKAERIGEKKKWF